MKLKFKRQQFQEDAARAVVDCFAGQPHKTAKYTLDTGRRVVSDEPQMALEIDAEEPAEGFKNSRILLTDDQILANIKKVQQRNGLRLSEKLEGRYNLTIEMETGTGKTYTYIKTMFELDKKYGWSKFIVVVPSIAIREGVYKTFQLTEDHFMSEYGKKIRYFIYNSRQLYNLESFASDAGINVMIINSQAFAARDKYTRRIYMDDLDDFQSRRPIDLIAQTNPILIIDEPQSVEGEKTKKALKDFNPLFTLRYSATHREEYNKIYRLDALDAYNMKLVKKIGVKGISVKGTTGTEGYLYLEGIEVSPKHPPLARMEYEERTKNGIKRVTRKFRETDDLHQLSGNLEQYRGYKIAEIDGYKNTVSFTNGVVLSAGSVQGDVNETNLRRIQIRETIKSHFEKERSLFYKGIKVLSLFFIDEVAKYRQYAKDGTEIKGEYARVFEEEYNNLLNEYINLFEDDYIRYLKGIRVEDTHKGYFSIDKNNRMVNPKVKARENESQDESAYELIMRDKERLLSFAEPTRFIFSHSALKEGWDNPNVFQICTLKHSDSTIKKRQEVGRGLRLCVNQNGDRVDSSFPGIDVHEINALTVIASESYESFARQLQSEIAETLSDRPQKADVDFFLNKVVRNERGDELVINELLAKKLNKSLYMNGYTDEDDNLKPEFFEAEKNGTVELPVEFAEYKTAVISLIKTIYSEDKGPKVDDDRRGKALEVNENFYKKEFQELWKRINRKSVYTVRFDSDELIEKCINALNNNLTVPDLQFSVKYGEMEQIGSKEQLKKAESFVVRETKTENLKTIPSFETKYDVVGKLIDETKLTRKTIVKILSGINATTFMLFRKNPEEFIIRAARLINEQKATTIIQQITYDLLDETFDASIFTRNNLKAVVGENAIAAQKHIYDYVVTDSITEKAFAKDLDVSKDISVFAKLPRSFFIPTPMGNYNPDWAIVFNDNNVKYIYFIAETKGSMSSLELREIEQAKIHCARKHFEKLNNSRFRYDVVESYERLMEIVKGVKN